MTQSSATNADSMLPTNARLLAGVRSTLHRIALRSADDHARSELAAIDVILGELLLRRDSGYYLGFYRDLRSLVEEGLGLLAAKLEPVTAGSIRNTLSTTQQSLDAALDFDTIGAQINRLQHCLELLVNAGRGAVPVDIQRYTSRVMAKENEFQMHRMPGAAGAAVVQPAYTKFTAERLQAYLRLKFPQRAGLRVTQFKQLVGGYQKITALFDIEDDSGKHESLVLRSEKDDRFLTLDAGEVVAEHAIVRIAYEAGIPVAEPMWLEADAALMGYRFFVSRKVAGDNYGSAIAADKPIDDHIARSFIQTMGRIHQLPINDVLRNTALGRWLAYPTLADNTRANVCYWKDQSWMKQANASPVYTRLTTWLLDNVPDDIDTPRLTHGDFGPHNVLVNEGVVSGVLDWESAHIGDQVEDIAWFLQSCAGKISGDKALAWYHEFTGWRISEYRLRYFEVFNCLKVLTGANSVNPMFEALTHASIEWCNLPLRWAPFISAQVESKIAAAEAAKPRA